MLVSTSAEFDSSCLQALCTLKSFLCCSLKLRLPDSRQGGVQGAGCLLGSDLQMNMFGKGGEEETQAEGET